MKKRDLYRIDLKTGARELIHAQHSRSYYDLDYLLSPDGKRVVFWDGSDYWSYDFEAGTKQNLTETLAVSFVDEEYDEFGYVPDYGIAGFVKDRNAVIVPGVRPFPD